MDPITLLATASAIWSGIKKASEFAAEAEGVWGQLSKYCGVADQLEQVIQEEKLRPKKPKLFAKQSAGNEVQEAFNAFEAEHKLMQIEKEFWDNLILWIGGGTIITIGLIVIYFSVMAIVNR